MGEVYRARDTRLDRIVAIKVLPERLSQDPAARQRFDREARAVSSLSHPHVCTLYDVGSWGDVDYLVMEHVLLDRPRSHAVFSASEAEAVSGHSGRRDPGPPVAGRSMDGLRLGRERPARSLRLAVSKAGRQVAGLALGGHGAVLVSRRKGDLLSNARKADGRARVLW